MISPSPNTKIFVHTASIDFRKGIDGLAAICKYEMSKDPFSGAMFVFSSCSKTAIKILYYDGQGYWVFHKRLSRGHFNWWPSGELCSEMMARDLSVLIWNGNPLDSRMQDDWRSVK